jgi:hypothetical protein
MTETRYYPGTAQGTASHFPLIFVSRWLTLHKESSTRCAGGTSPLVRSRCISLHGSISPLPVAKEPSCPTSPVMLDLRFNVQRRMFCSVSARATPHPPYPSPPHPLQVISRTNGCMLRTPPEPAILANCPVRTIR